MGICKKQLKNLIERTLRKIPLLYTPDAVTLLMMTCAAESDLGHWIHQIEGPACGIMMVEPETMWDNYTSYLDFRRYLSDDIQRVSDVSKPNIDALEGNLIFNTLMARIKYFRSPGALPSSLEGMAKYHEKYYNAGGSADWEVTLAKYQHFCV